MITLTKYNEISLTREDLIFELKKKYGSSWELDAPFEDETLQMFRNFPKLSDGPGNFKLRNSREIYIRLYKQGLSVNEIADRLNRKPNTVRSVLIGSGVLPKFSKWHNIKVLDKKGKLVQMGSIRRISQDFKIHPTALKRKIKDGTADKNGYRYIEVE